jgi:hypothetical protein
MILTINLMKWLNGYAITHATHKSVLKIFKHNNKMKHKKHRMTKSAHFSYMNVFMRQNDLDLMEICANDPFSQ